MSSYLEGWGNVLKAAAPRDQNTPAAGWICETWNTSDGRVYKVFTPQEYKNFYATHSWWDRTFNNSCKKLSLEEISDVSRFYWNHYKTTQDAMGRKIERLAMSENIDGVNAEENIKEALRKMKPDGSVQSIKDSLSALSRRSAAKHAAERTQGTWGKIKWAIWFYCKNVSQQLDALVGRMSVKGDFTNFCTKACDSLRERVILNMDWFEEAVHYDGSDVEHPRTDFDTPAATARYATPKDVQKKWITKFGVDKFNISTLPSKPKKRGVPNFEAIMSIKPHEVELATSSRVRIYAMVNMWKHLDDFKNEQSEVAAPAPVAETLMLK